MSIEATTLNRPGTVTPITLFDAFARLLADIRAVQQRQSAERREANHEVRYFGY